MIYFLTVAQVSKSFASVVGEEHKNDGGSKEKMDCNLDIITKILFNFALMEKTKKIEKPLNSKGAAIFKKMLDDKNAIHQHLKNGGKLTDLKDKYNFLDPLSIYKA